MKKCTDCHCGCPPEGPSPGDWFWAIFCVMLYGAGIYTIATNMDNVIEFIFG